MLCFTGSWVTAEKKQKVKRKKCDYSSCDHTTESLGMREGGREGVFGETTSVCSLLTNRQSAWCHLIFHVSRLWWPRCWTLQPRLLHNLVDSNVNHFACCIFERSLFGSYWLLHSLTIETLHYESIRLYYRLRRLLVFIISLNKSLAFAFTTQIHFSSFCYIK